MQFRPPKKTYLRKIYVFRDHRFRSISLFILHAFAGQPVNVRLRITSCPQQSRSPYPRSSAKNSRILVRSAFADATEPTITPAKTDGEPKKYGLPLGEAAEGWG